MRLDRPLLEGRFLRRYQRFFVDVELPSGEVLVAHCPNTGSLKGCLTVGARVWLRDSQDPARKLRYTWQAIEANQTWVNVDTGLPNQALRSAVEAAEVPELRGYARLRSEVKYGQNSRIDLLLEDDARPPCYIEIKNTTLAENGLARFPDAVTSRGKKHLEELVEVVRNGARAVQFFFVSRADVESFRPADDIDPAYGAALRQAAKSGVELLAYRTRLSPTALELDQRLPIEL